MYSLLWYFSLHATDLFSLLRKQIKWRTYASLYFFRGVIAESEDVIKAAADGLGKNGFINYYGLQVYSCLPSCLKIYFPFISEAHLVSFSYFICLAFWKWFSSNTPCWCCFAQRRVEGCCKLDSWSKGRRYPTIFYMQPIMSCMLSSANFC